MRHPKQILEDRYRHESVNIQFKASNLYYVLIVVCTATAIISLFAVITGRYSNIFAALPAFLVSLACIAFLLGGHYRTVSTIYALFIGLTPLGIMLAQTILGYRDIYLFFYFAAPILVLSILTGFARWQLWILATEIGVSGIAYYFLFLVPRIKASAGDIATGMIFSVIYFILTTVLLSISARVEKRIISRLQANQQESDARLVRMESVIGNSQKALAIGHEDGASGRDGCSWFPREQAGTALRTSQLRRRRRADRHRARGVCIRSLADDRKALAPRQAGRTMESRGRA